MLLEIAIGDAYGAGFEFAHREKIDRHNDLSAFIPHELGIAAGHYTDDTQMSVAVAETMLSGVPLSSDTFADAFVRCYRRDPRKGYATGFQALLDACEDGAALRQRIRPDSRRNGAAMRAVPLGLIANKQELLAAATAQARVTHDTEEGVISARIVALMAHLLLHQRMPLVQLPSSILVETGFRLRLDWDAEVKCDANETMHAVATALLRNRSQASLLRDCVNFGGDVDSVAAIALGLSSLTHEYAKDLPEHLGRTLESGEFGSRFMSMLDGRLAERYSVLAQEFR